MTYKHYMGPLGVGRDEGREREEDNGCSSQHWRTRQRFDGDFGKSHARRYPQFTSKISYIVN